MHTQIYTHIYCMICYRERERENVQMWQNTTISNLGEGYTGVHCTIPVTFL